MATVHLVCGPAGAGKTTRALELAAEHRAVIFIIDEWFARLYGPDMPAPLREDWLQERIIRLEHVIWSSARGVLACGVDVVLDLGFMQRGHRALYRKLAAFAQARAITHFVDADVAVRRERVRERNQRRGATFSLPVDDAMFEMAERLWQPPRPDET